MKYASYFLIVSDYIKWAKNNDIPVGPGRGSGAGSLVAWCLSITDVDPIKFNLIFERFLNPDRISMPDFDVDFCEEKRDLVFEYLKKKYKDSVAHIITFGKLKARMVIRDVGRVLGLPYGFVDSISKMIPFDPSRPLSLSECINREPRLQKLINEDTRVKKLTDLSLKLEGLNRNVATHAAGVVIADKKLTEAVPLYKDSTANLLLPSTQFDMYSAENAGLIKFDFLGLKTLTVINKTQKLINKKDKNFLIENINYEDQKVFDLLSSGNTVGLFQLESSGMREALMQMKPNHLEDIIALVALYRPGPMSNIPTYNDCKHGKKKPDYLHSYLEDILKPTYGVIIYQEQVMQIAQKLSGFTAGEADILRRAMGKKKRAELEKQKQRFIDGAVRNGISKEVAASIFLKIEPFAEYGFNKSHAAAYAIIAYQTAYLKTYFPHDFFSASMTMDISNQNKLSEFYEEIKRLNINIVRPDINKCFADFRSVDNNFYV
jgi:DNA polymerase-3 subunit alpha